MTKNWAKITIIRAVIGRAASLKKKQNHDTKSIRAAGAKKNSIQIFGAPQAREKNKQNNNTTGREQAALLKRKKATSRYHQHPNNGREKSWASNSSAPQAREKNNRMCRDVTGHVAEAKKKSQNHDRISGPVTVLKKSEPKNFYHAVGVRENLAKVMT